MTDKLTPKGRRSTLALIGVLAALGIGSVAIPTVAAAAPPIGQADADYRPSAWAPAGDLPSAGRAPSLTNQVGRPESGSGSELWLGYSFLGASLLVLACGLVARAAERGRLAGPPRGHAGTPSAAAARARS